MEVGQGCRGAGQWGGSKGGQGALLLPPGGRSSPAACKLVPAAGSPRSKMQAPCPSLRTHGPALQALASHPHLELEHKRVAAKGAALGQRGHAHAVLISAARAGGLVPAQLHGAAAGGGHAQVGGGLGADPAGAEGGGGAGRLRGGLH